MRNPILLLALLASVPAVQAATLDVRGRLTGATGQPESGSCLLRFKLFDVAPNSPEAWAESLFVSLEGGEFRATLGKTKPVPVRLLTEGYRLAIESPAGTGWKALATAVAPGGGAPAEARAAATPKVAEVRRLKAQLEAKTEPKAQRAVFKKDAVPEPAEAPPAAAPSEEETARLKARLEALEKQLEPGPRAVKSRTYDVKPGDTLQSVAYKLWGDPTRWADIYNANADRIQRGGDLRPGQKLLVPEVGR